MTKDLDLEILKVLEKDARIPAKELAVMLDLDEKTVEKRIEKLRKDGVIRKFIASINWKKLGRHNVSAIIQVKVVPQERSGFAKICKELSKDPRVVDLVVASGEYDLNLTVEAENIDELSKFVTEKLAPKKEVVGTYTMIVLDEYKRNGVLSFEDKSERLKITP